MRNPGVGRAWLHRAPLTLLLAVACCLLWAQNVGEYYHDVTDREWDLQIFLNTAGFGGGFHHGRTPDLYNKLFWELQFMVNKHPKSIRSINAFFNNVRPIRYGHLYSLFLLQGGFPNRSGYIPVHRWIAVCEKGGAFTVNSLPDAFERLGLRGTIVNRGVPLDPSLFSAGVRESVRKAAESLRRDKSIFEQENQMKLRTQLSELALLKKKHVEQMELRLGEQIESVRKAREEQMRKELDRHFDSAERYLRDTTVLEDAPYLQLVAVFAGV